MKRADMTPEQHAKKDEYNRKRREERVALKKTAKGRAILRAQSKVNWKRSKEKAELLGTTVKRMHGPQDPETIEKRYEAQRHHLKVFKERHPERFKEQTKIQRKRYKAKKKNAAKAVVTLSSNEAFRLIQKEVPRASRWFPEATRWDVISDLCLAMLEGKCSPEELSTQVRIAMRPYNNHANKELSLDAPLPGTEGKQTYLDKLEGGL